MPDGYLSVRITRNIHMIMGTTKEQAIEEMSNMQQEAAAYAKLHDLNFASFFESGEAEFKSIYYASPAFQVEFSNALFQSMPDFARERLVDMLFGADPEPKKPRFSLLWGLITIN